jgi:hypothetical protein
VTRSGTTALVRAASATYPRAPHQAWSLAVKDLVPGPGSGTARLDDMPGASGRAPANVLPFDSTWVTYVTSDDALPRLVVPTSIRGLAPPGA